MSPSSPIWPSRLRAGLGITVALLFALASPAMATTTTTVTSLGDGNPSCAASPSDCTLRGAINAAQSSAGDDVINFSGTGTIDLQSALPDLPDGVQINGPGAGQLNVHHSDFFLDSFRIFTIPSGRTVSISGLTVSGGQVVASSAVAFQQAGGGGIYNGGNLTLDNVVVRDNFASATSTITALAYGGGIFSNGGNLTLRRVSVSGNHTAATADGSAGGSPQAVSAGGGIYFSGGGALTITNSTINDNVADFSPAGLGGPQGARGGGIYTSSGATIGGATVTANSAKTSGANINSSGITLGDTIVSNPLGGAGNCSGGAPTSEAYNLEDGPPPGTCGLTSPTDVHGDPMLGPFAGAANVPAYSLLSGSPAIDAGMSFGLASDQLGQPRPSDLPSTPNAAGGDGADIGAFEVQAPAPPLDTTPPDTTPPDTTITKVKVKAKKHLAIVGFNSSESGSAFRCKLDKKPLKPCTSPRKLKHLKGGKHRIAVVATDAAGNVDPTPAKKTFKV